MLRWNSPVVHMARTATADVEIRGQLIREGDVVVMLYGSANRDEDVFGPDSEEFKVTRHPNPHIAFGCGEHSCVGAQLARLEAAVLFDELLRRFPSSSWSVRSTGCGPPWCPASSGCRCGWEPERCDLEYTPEQEQLRAEMRATLEQVMTPERSAAISDRIEGGPAVRDCVRALAAANLLGVGWPKEYGGQGFSAIEQFIFAEEAQRVNAPIPLVTLNTVGPTLMQCGTEEQKQKFLPAILDGSVEFAIGYSEPGAGSDLASLRTTAVRDGDDYVINGQKMFTSGAAYADYIWLAARTDPNAKKHKGISILIVPTSSPGFSWQPLHTMPGISTFYTFYDDVRVPASAHRGRRKPGLAADHHPAELRTRRAGQPRRARAAVREDPGLGQRPPSSTAGASSTSPGCSWRWPGSRHRSPPTNSINLRVNAAMTKGVLNMGEASAAKVFGTELTQQVARQLLEVLDRNGLRRGADAPLRGALESAYRSRSSTRSAAAPTRFSVTSSPWPDWACREHLVTFGPPDKSGGQLSDRPDRVPRQAAGARRPAHRWHRKALGGTGSGQSADDSALGVRARRHEPRLPRPGVRGHVAVRRHRVAAGDAANLDDAVAETGRDRRARRRAHRDQIQPNGIPRRGRIHQHGGDQLGVRDRALSPAGRRHQRDDGVRGRSPTRRRRHWAPASS